jgi:hypothetical protein
MAMKEFSQGELVAGVGEQNSLGNLIFRPIPLFGFWRELRVEFIFFVW